MVKNTKGGKGHKSLGRKYQSQTNNVLRLSTDPLEQYAFVTKIYGGGMCEVWFIDKNNKNVKIIGHIRKKMKGRQKRHNTIIPNSYVLIGLRDWESEPKNGDIICIYDENQIELLKQNPSVNLSSLNQFNTTKHESSVLEDDEFTFGAEDENVKIDTTDITETFITDSTSGDIDIDDI
jgi:translation initiation factor IF-1